MIDLCLCYSFGHNSFSKTKKDNCKNTTRWELVERNFSERSTHVEQLDLKKNFRFLLKKLPVIRNIF